MTHLFSDRVSRDQGPSSELPPSIAVIGGTHACVDALATECRRLQPAWHVTTGIVSRSASRNEATEDARPDRALAVVTWSELSECGPALLASRLKHDATELAGRPDVPCLIAVVPYSSFRDEHGQVVRSYCPPTSGHAAGACARLVARFRQECEAFGNCRVVETPMVITSAIVSPCAYASEMSRIIAAIKCLVYEVRSKVPAYFEQHPLRLAPTSGNPDLLSWEALVRWLLSESVRSDGSASTDAFVSDANWAAVADGCHRGLKVRLEREDDSGQHNWLDEVFNELVVAVKPMCGVTTRLQWSDSSHVVRAIGLGDEIEKFASMPPFDWEDSYRVVPKIDIATAGLEPRHYLGGHAQGDRACLDRTYFVGGRGPRTVVALVPLGVDPGYFADLLRRLDADHRLMVWEMGGHDWQGIDADARALDQLLAAETELHLVAWCGSIRLVAKLLERSPEKIQSVCLFAPEPDADDQQTEGYRGLVRFFSQLTASDDGVDRAIARAQASWRAAVRDAPSANLAQYNVSAEQKRSPLQYHPAGFSSAVTEELFGDSRRILDIARSIDARIDAAAAQVLCAYPNRVMVVAGTADALIRYQSARHRFGQLANGVLVSVRGGNHYALTEHASALAPLLREFIGGRQFVEGQWPRHGIGRIRIERTREVELRCRVQSL